jgi:hypothetical protein
MQDTFDYADSGSFDTGEWQDTEYESFPDSAEAGGWGEARRRPPARPSAGRSAYQPPRSSGSDRPVLQSQLKEALARVSQQITINSNAIRTVDGRVRGVSEEQKKLGAFARKENADRKKELETVRRDLQQTRELSALIPLATANATGPIATLAPLLHLVPGGTLMGGADSSGGSGGSGSLLGGSNLLAIAAIAVASGAFK